jgi:hypothetical protein
MSENKKQEWQLKNSFKSAVFGKVEIHKTIDDSKTSFKSEGSRYGLSIKEFTLKLSAVNDDKLIADTVRVFASYYDANFYGKMVKNTLDNKEYPIEHFRNIVIQNNPNIETVTNNHLMSIINDKNNTYILIDEIGTVNEPSTMNGLVIKDVTKTIKNNSFEGSNNVEVVKKFSDDEIIRFKAWYLDNKDTARTYGITRDFNPEWNEYKNPTSALVKYRKCFDNEILNSGVNNNIPTVQSTTQNTVKTTSNNSLGLSI